MHSIIGVAVLGGGVVWQQHFSSAHEEALAVTFTLTGGGIDDRQALRIVKKLIADNGVTWIKPGTSTWQLETDQLKSWFKTRNPGSTFLDGFDWLQGVLNIAPIVKHHMGIAHLDRATTPAQTTVHLFVYREEYELNKATQLFLSHKGANKPLVLQYFNVLKELGFDPWLDDDAMPAGTKLHRGIQDGFKNSCAAIFFITPEFKDEGYLAKEIDYAIAEENAKGARFKIVALVFTDASGNKGVIPRLLEPYVWKEPSSDLEALLQIIKAIPLEVGPVTWRAGI